jgi:hypothetical protein
MSGSRDLNVDSHLLSDLFSPKMPYGIYVETVELQQTTQQSLTSEAETKQL